ncbi:MAG: hypothetical protein RLZZ308_12 [Candidatus Parcubacteria bacterium]|jgi:hypothetical protein
MKSRICNYITLILLLTISYINAFTLATAQTTPQANSEPSAAIVATVSLFDATITPINTKKNTYTISFSLYNSTGVQSDILYAIAINSTNGSVAYWQGSQAISLGQGEKKYFAKEVTVPSYMLDTNVQFVILAKTKSDLPLANHAFERFPVSGTPSGLLLEDCTVKPKNATSTYAHNKGVDVLPNELMIITCPIKNLSKKTVSLSSVNTTTKRRSIFGDVTTQTQLQLSNPITLTANASGTLSFTVDPADTPQAYHVLVSPQGVTEEYNNAHFQYVTTGLSATIQNTKIAGNRFKVGDMAPVFIYYTGSASNFPGSRYGGDKNLYDLHITLTGKNNTLCGTLEVQNTTPLDYVRIPVQTPCIEPVAEVTLTDARTKRKLDSVSIETLGTTNDPSLNSLQELHEQGIEKIIEGRYGIFEKKPFTPIFVLFAILILAIIIISIVKGKNIEKFSLQEITSVIKNKISTFKNTSEKKNSPEETISLQNNLEKNMRPEPVIKEEPSSLPSAMKTIVVFLFILTSPSITSIQKVKADTVAFNDGGTAVWQCISWTGGYDPTCTQEGWWTGALNEYTATINLNSNTFAQGVAGTVTATPSFYAKWLGCSNVCDCFVRSSFNTDLQVKNSAGTPIVVEFEWKKNVLCDEQWADGRPNGDCSVVATKENKQNTYIATLTQSLFGVKRAYAAATASYGAKQVHGNPGSLSPGSYTASFNISTQSDHGTGAFGTATINLPFTVTGSVTPTVNLNFVTF